MEKLVYSETHKGQGFEVEDKDFMWSRIIGDTPTDKVVREIFQNTMENENTNQVVCGEMKIKDMKGKKFYMINNGKGIDNIKKLEKLFGSEKNKDRKYNGNNNTGVRLMGAAANKLGTAFITKYNGVISAFFMNRPFENSYNVQTYFLDNDFNPYELLPILAEAQLPENLNLGNYTVNIEPDNIQESITTVFHT